MTWGDALKDRYGLFRDTECATHHAGGNNRSAILKLSTLKNTFDVRRSVKM